SRRDESWGRWPCLCSYAPEGVAVTVSRQLEGALLDHYTASRARSARAPVARTGKSDASGWGQGDGPGDLARGLRLDEGDDLQVARGDAGRPPEDDPGPTRAIE